MEDQHLLKLPRTGFIAFGIRILSFRWTDLLQEGGFRISVRRKLESMPPEVARYKGLENFLPPEAEE